MAYSGSSVTDDSPVTQVSWNDAVAFLQLAQRPRTANTLLPTRWRQLDAAAESERVSSTDRGRMGVQLRAGTTTQYSFGDDWKEHDKYGWSNKNAGGRPHSVSSLPANALVCTTCTAMCGNGVRTGTTVSGTRNRRATIGWSQQGLDPGGPWRRLERRARLQPVVVPELPLHPVAPQQQPWLSTCP